MESITTPASKELLELVRILPIDAEQTLSLRQSVLWPDSSLSQMQLPEDDSGFHFGAFISSTSKPIAVISLFSEALPLEGDVENLTSTPPMRFRKFACEPLFQGQGIGTKLLKHIFTVARSELGAGVVWCDARTSTAEWYHRRGMTSFGMIFMKGPVEYIRMKINV